jgi:tRNA-dihydrouridine synthase 1
MISSDRFAVDAKYREEEFQTVAADRPLVAHFSANNPEVFLAAAKHVESFCDAIGRSCMLIIGFNSTPIHC